MGLRRQRSPRYRQNGLFVEPHKAIILPQPRLSSKPSLETVSLKLTNCAPFWGRILSTTSAVVSLTSSSTSAVVSLTSSSTSAVVSLTSSSTSGVIGALMPFASAIPDLLFPRLLLGG